MSSLPPDPSASVIIPSYESHATVAATLQSLRNQLFDDFEIILIDSGESNDVARIAADFPEVRYHRSEQRLLPHEARNVGVKLARSDILIFTDPDVVAAPDWLEKLISTYRIAVGPVVGAIASLQRDWLEIGVHIAKFDLWLPGGRQRTVPIGPTANFLCVGNLCALDKCFGLRQTPSSTTIIAARFGNCCRNVSCAALILPGCGCVELIGILHIQSLPSSRASCHCDWRNLRPAQASAAFAPAAWLITCELCLSL